MKLKIIVTPKEIADLIREMPNQPVFNSSFSIDGKAIAENHNFKGLYQQEVIKILESYNNI